MRGWKKLAATLETIKKLTSIRHWQKQKIAPLFPVPLYALVQVSRYRGRISIIFLA